MITSALIFLHGLGDSSKGWSFLSSHLSSCLPSTVFIFPDAPSSPVACNGGSPSTSWFNIARIPLDFNEPESPAGLTESVSNLHAIIESTMAKHNLPASKIILGGFSQGGAMSLLAGGGFQAKEGGGALGGVVCLSGWMLEKEKNRANWASEAMGRCPLFVGHGECDQVVLTKLGKKAFEDVREGRKESEGDTTSVLRIYEGEGHGANEAELSEMAHFISKILC